MKSIAIAPCLLVAFALLQGCCCESHDELVAAGKKIDAQFCDSFSKGDVDGVMALYWNSPELVLYPPGTEDAKGYDQVKEQIANALKGMQGAKLEFSDAKYVPEGHAVAVWGTFTLSGGQGPAMVGRYSEVIEKKDGKWVIILDHASVPTNGPG